MLNVFLPSHLVILPSDFYSYDQYFQNNEPICIYNVGGPSSVIQEEQGTCSFFLAFKAPCKTLWKDQFKIPRDLIGHLNIIQILQ